MGIIGEEIGRYDPYTDKFIKNTTTDTTTDRTEVGTDGNLHILSISNSISNSFGLYARSLEELDKCDYIDKSTKLYTINEVIAMLTELQKEIDELPNHELQNSDWKSGFIHGLADVQEKVIQQKIDKLKENEDGNK